MAILTGLTATKYVVDGETFYHITSKIMNVDYLYDAEGNLFNPAYIIDCVGIPLNELFSLPKPVKLEIGYLQLEYYSALQVELAKIVLNITEGIKQLKR